MDYSDSIGSKFPYVSRLSFAEQIVGFLLPPTPMPGTEILVADVKKIPEFIKELENPSVMRSYVYIRLKMLRGSPELENSFEDPRDARNKIEELLMQSPWLMSPTEGIVLKVKSFGRFAHRFSSIDGMADNDRTDLTDERIELIAEYVAHLLLDDDELLSDSSTQLVTNVKNRLLHSGTITPDMYLKLRVIVKRFASCEEPYRKVGDMVHSLITLTILNAPYETKDKKKYLCSEPIID